MRESQRHTGPAFLLECFMLYINKIRQHIINFFPSLPSEFMLYINCSIQKYIVERPSLPSEFMLYINLKWHYRLLQNFNPATNDKGVILVHLYFRHFCQGP